MTNMSYEFVQFAKLDFVLIDPTKKSSSCSEKSFRMDLDIKYLKYGLDFANFGLLQS